MPTANAHPLLSSLTRVAEALERINPPPAPAQDLADAKAYVWNPQSRTIRPVEEVNCIELELLCGIEFVSRQLLENTRNFAQGFPANNALLWGARGTGKSALIKAVHAHVSKDFPIKIIEIHSEDIATLPNLMAVVKNAPYPIILFCDDLSFESHDASYKALKAVLDGGLEGRPKNIVFYATSNRRHLMARDMIENERATAINPGEAVEEKVSLSDRFGLWLSFHNVSQDNYLAMVSNYVRHFNIPINGEALRQQALEWSATRGSRSGRVAWQFIQHLAGTLKVKL